MDASAQDRWCAARPATCLTPCPSDTEHMPRDGPAQIGRMQDASSSSSCGGAAQPQQCSSATTPVDTALHLLAQAMQQLQLGTSSEARVLAVPPLVPHSPIPISRSTAVAPRNHHDPNNAAQGVPHGSSSQGGGNDVPAPTATGAAAAATLLHQPSRGPVVPQTETQTAFANPGAWLVQPSSSSTGDGGVCMPSEQPPPTSYTGTSTPDGGPAIARRLDFNSGSPAGAATPMPTLRMQQAPCTTMNEQLQHACANVVTGIPGIPTAPNPTAVKQHSQQSNVGTSEQPRAATATSMPAVEPVLRDGMVQLVLPAVPCIAPCLTPASACVPARAYLTALRHFCDSLMDEMAKDVSPPTPPCQQAPLNHIPTHHSTMGPHTGSTVRYDPQL